MWTKNQLFLTKKRPNNSKSTTIFFILIRIPPPDSINNKFHLGSYVCVFEINIITMLDVQCWQKSQQACNPRNTFFKFFLSVFFMYVFPLFPAMTSTQRCFSLLLLDFGEFFVLTYSFFYKKLIYCRKIKFKIF